MQITLKCFILQIMKKYKNPKDNVTFIILTNAIGSYPENFIEEIANLYIRD